MKKRNEVLFCIKATIYKDTANSSTRLMRYFAEHEIAEDEYYGAAEWRTK